MPFASSLRSSPPQFTITIFSHSSSYVLFPGLCILMSPTFVGGTKTEGLANSRKQDKTFPRAKTLSPTPSKMNRGEFARLQLFALPSR